MTDRAFSILDAPYRTHRDPQRRVRGAGADACVEHLAAQAARVLRTQDVAVTATTVSPLEAFSEARLVTVGVY